MATRREQAQRLRELKDQIHLKNGHLEEKEERHSSLRTEVMGTTYKRGPVVERLRKELNAKLEELSDECQALRREIGDLEDEILEVEDEMMRDEQDP